MQPSQERLKTIMIGGEQAHAGWHHGGDRGVLVFHGLNSERRELGQLPAALAGHGLTVVAPDLRGHGASDGPRGVLSESRALDDVLAWKYKMSEEGVRLVAIGGHSLGGVWALAAARRMHFEAVFTVSTPSTLTGELGALELAAYKAGGFVHRLANRVGKGDLWAPYKVQPKDVLDDPESIDRMKREGLIDRRVPLENVDPFLRIDASVWAAQVKAPGLISWCERDRVVSRENARRVYEAYGGEKAWVELPAPHSCFYDAGTARASAERIAAWVAGTLDGS